MLGGGGARAERVPFIHPPAPRERRQTSEIAKKGRTHPCGTHPWPSDLGGLCSVSDISGVQPSQRMQAAATPLHLLVAEQTPALTFCLKSPLSPRRQQDVEGRYYQSGTPETWLILPPPLGVYSVAEGSQSTSARTRPCSAQPRLLPPKAFSSVQRRRGVKSQAAFVWAEQDTVSSSR